MKHYILFIFTLISLQYSVVYAQFKAVHIPDSILATMKIDGNASDWDWVPEKYLITEQSMNKNTFSGDTDFWKSQMIVGWNDLSHKLYIIAKITDDIFITNNSLYYTNDCMQFAINADNEGGRYEGQQDNRLKHSILYAITPSSDKDFKLLINSGPDWMQEKQHIDWAVKHSKNENDEYETVYEMSLSLWDKWESEGPNDSFPTKLYPLKRIRLALVFNDSDASDETFTGWSNFTGGDWWKNADHIPKLILDMPSDKKDVSWQGIHYILTNE